MVYDTDGFFDVDNIRPNSIDTNMLTVGSKSQQFVLLRSRRRLLFIIRSWSITERTVWVEIEIAVVSESVS